MNSENSRIRLLIKRYREHFKFSQNDIVKLTGLTQSAYSSLETGKGNIDFDKTNLVSNVYGLKVWEFINPKQKVPTLDSLPNTTKKIALKNKSKPKSNYHLDLPEKIKIILRSGRLPTTFTVNDIKNLLKENIQSDINASRITTTIKRIQFEELCEVGKSGKSKLYSIRKK
ncbi:helix-turn-helix transcriptional regulator [Chryseobacterium sp. NEB161]|nr:helix-turn-helix transcriptional regulator [Chryseobacterium sp. NEB161]